MSEKGTAFEQTLKYKGFFEYSDFYEFCFDWLKEGGYNVKEPEYSEKVTAGGKDISITWEY